MSSCAFTIGWVLIRHNARFCLIECTTHCAPFQVRFYADGSPAHIGAQPTLLVNTSIQVLRGGDGRRQLQDGQFSQITFGVQNQTDPPSPFDAADTDDSSLPAVDIVSNTTISEQLPYTAPKYVCGDGVRATVENW